MQGDRGRHGGAYGDHGRKLGVEGHHVEVPRGYGALTRCLRLKLLLGGEAQ